ETRGRGTHLRAMALLLPSGLVALFIAWVVAGPWLLELRRDRWRARPFPREWRAILDRRVPYLRRLPERLRGELEGHVQVFVEEKQFIGCAGLEVTDEVRVVIAAQACLLVLGRRGEPFPGARHPGLSGPVRGRARGGRGDPGIDAREPHGAQRRIVDPRAGRHLVG